MSSSPSNGRVWLFRILKLAIVSLVLAGIVWEVYKAKHAFAEHQFKLTDVDFRWLPVAGAVYLLGMLPLGLFWFAVMRALGQQPRVGETLRAFYIGHLGKYVPGKAMVVVLRTGLVRSDRVDTTVAAASVFIETLTMMAVGAFLAAVILAVRFADQWLLLLLAVGLMLCAGVPTLPPVFRKLVYVLKVRKLNPRIGDLLQGLTLRLMLGGWMASLVGWCLFGVSLWATLRAMPGLVPQPVDLLQTFPLMTATVCLAMVAGFLSLLPGGVLVREYMILALMEGPYGTVAACVSAVLLRLVWMASEALLAAALYISIRCRGAAEPGEGAPAATDNTLPPRSQVEGSHR